MDRKLVTVKTAEKIYNSFYSTRNFIKFLEEVVDAAWHFGKCNGYCRRLFLWRLQEIAEEKSLFKCCNCDKLLVRPVVHCRKCHRYQTWEF